MTDILELMLFIEKFSLDPKKRFYVKHAYSGTRYVIVLDKEERGNDKEKWTITEMADNKIPSESRGIYLSGNQVIETVGKLGLDYTSFYKQLYNKIAVMLAYAGIMRAEAEKMEEGIVKRSEESIAKWSARLKEMLKNIAKDKAKKDNTTELKLVYEGDDDGDNHE